MPESPYLAVVADALHVALVGRPVRSVAAPGRLSVGGTPAALKALGGQHVESSRQQGKFLLIDLERDRFGVNPSLTGRFQLASARAKNLS